MGGILRKPSEKHICAALLAHVDAGKTTLSENILYHCGAIRRKGRVDNKDTFLDNDEMERSRGITIFSKQAVFTLGDLQVTLLDTPGHTDFSSEMERTLSVLDYAVLLVSASDGVQGHTKTLWELLHRFSVPTFLFINKMDQPGADREQLLAHLRSQLDSACAGFGMESDAQLFSEGQAEQARSGAAWHDIFMRDAAEDVALCDEVLLDAFLDGVQPSKEAVCSLVQERRLFPCFFGSALKGTGVAALLAGLKLYARPQEYPQEFGARIFKISRDDKGERLTHLKITGGALCVKELLRSSTHGWEDKVNQIRIYSGAGCQTVATAKAGEICAVTGLQKSREGEMLGYESGQTQHVIEPLMNYTVLLPEGTDAFQMLQKLRELEEEDPQLHISWREQTQEIHVQLMGQVQMEILQSIVKKRFGTDISFDIGSIVYRETITKRVEGVGHFEPLRHYAEVHLILEPAPRGSGISFASDCSEDELDTNWQRLILTHLQEKKHAGVLTGAEITDMKIILAAGRAHQKHTEGGDFRQATYRALRQGLMQAESILLEPVYGYELAVPLENIGRAMNDIERMHGTFDAPETVGGLSVLKGKAPAATMQAYHLEVTAYTHGKGRLACWFNGYAPCHNEADVIADSGYEADRDVENPSSSVFCTHGGGYYVEWKLVPEHMHLPSVLEQEEKAKKAAQQQEKTLRHKKKQDGQPRLGSTLEQDKELAEIFERTYGKTDSHALRPALRRKQVSEPPVYKPGRKKEPKETYLLVDGYNVIFAWEELRQIAQDNIDGARGRLMDILSNYQGIRRTNVILVFDAYRVSGHKEEVIIYHNISVVYTKEAETADQYIEKTAHKMGKEYQVTVATSDGVEQVIIRGQGCLLLSARELELEIKAANEMLRSEYLERHF